jgi:hypothetical protein
VPPPPHAGVKRIGVERMIERVIFFTRGWNSKAGTAREAAKIRPKIG